MRLEKLLSVPMVAEFSDMHGHFSSADGRTLGRAEGGALTSTRFARYGGGVTVAVTALPGKGWKNKKALTGSIKAPASPGD